jgi:hypothetical protein
VCVFNKEITIDNNLHRLTQLDDFLFDEEQEYLDLAAVRNFDRLDFIFINGKDMVRTTHLYL